MPLHDHFAPPLSQTRPWEAFHSAWASQIAAQLNGTLPEGYVAHASGFARADGRDRRGDTRPRRFR